MATNDLGAEWPPEYIATNMRKAIQMRHLYKGEHELVFADKKDANRRYITINLLGAMTNLLTWRLFGEPFYVELPEDTGGNQEFIEKLISSNRLNEKLLAAAILQSYSGDCMFKVRYDAAGQRIVITPVDPNHVITQFDELDNEKIIEQTIWTVLKSDDGKDTYIWFESHQLREDNKAYIANLLYKCNESDGVIKFDYKEDRVALTAHKVTMNLPEEQATGLSRLLVCGIRGDSDYNGLLTNQSEINNRFSQRSKTLDVHAKPFMYGPMLVNENGTVPLSDFEYIETNSTDVAPMGMLVWDASLSAVSDAIKDMLEAFAAVAGIEMSAIMAPEGGGPQSGRAIKLSQMRTQAKVLGKQVIFTPLVTELFCTAIELAMLPGVVLKYKPKEKLVLLDEQDVTIKFSDGLPSDTLDEIEEQGKRVEYGLQSKRDAIKILDECSDEEADAKLLQIQAEEAGSLHSAFATPSPASTGSPSFLSITDTTGSVQ